MKYAVLFFSLLFLVQCSNKDTGSIEMKLLSVEVGSDLPGKECQDLGSVQGTSYGETKNAYQLSMRDMKIQALRNDGNFVHLKSTINNGQIVNGTVFKCPKKVVAPEPEEDEKAKKKEKA